MGVASVGLILAGLGSAQGQEDATPGFSNGTAKATAVVARIAPGVGALELGISSGVAVAEVKNTIAQAQAETLDLGLIGSTLTAESCTGTILVKPSDLPQSSRVDSRGGDTSTSADEAPVSGATIGGGRREVAATTTPAASAISTVVATLGPLLTLDGGRAEATTEVIPGEARVAHAAVDVDLNIGGFLRLGALRWEATHRTGSEPRAEGTFDVGTASLLGIPIPMDSLSMLETTVNQLLEASGVSITFPKVERFTEPADVVRVTPLRILLKDSPAGKAVLGPVLNLSRAQREQLFDEIAKVYCSAAAALLVGDIGISVASGTGFLAIEIGGAEATTGDLVLESPFGGGEAPAATAVNPPTRANLPAPVARTPLPVSSPRAPEPIADVGPLEEHCESAHPLQRTGCSEGALLALGLVGLGATAVVGGLDWRHQRRRVAAAVPSGGGTG